MDIVHIVLGKANPNRMNGVNKVVYQLANRQAQAGKNVQVWGIAENTEHTYDKRSFTTVLFQKLRNPFAISSKLKQAIADAEDTVFHIHGAWVPTFWAVAKCIAKYQKKAVLTPHGGYNTIAVQKSGWKKKVYFTIFEKSRKLEIKYGKNYIFNIET